MDIKPLFNFILILPCAALLCAVIFYFFKRNKTAKPSGRIKTAVPAQNIGGARRRNVADAYRHARLATRMRVDSGSSGSINDLVRATTDKEGREGIEGSESEATEPTKKKVGTKKAAKLVEKERRREEREAEERYREQQRKLEDEAIRNRKLAEEAEEKAEAERVGPFVLHITTIILFLTNI